MLHKYVFSTDHKVVGLQYALTSLLFLLGGFALDVVNAIVLDSTGAAYVTGETRSDNYPVTDGAYQRERRGNSDAFITKLSPDGASLVFSTYFGGDGPETGWGDRKSTRLNSSHT